MVDKISMYTALKRMRQLTESGVPFEVVFFTTNGKVKRVQRAMLRHGYRKEQSDKHLVLIGYVDVETNQYRQFHRSLLMQFNNIDIQR